MVFEKALLSARLFLLFLMVSGHDVNVQTPIIIIHLDVVCVWMCGIARALCARVYDMLVSYLLVCFMLATIQQLTVLEGVSQCL